MHRRNKFPLNTSALRKLLTPQIVFLLLSLGWLLLSTDSVDPATAAALGTQLFEKSAGKEYLHQPQRTNDRVLIQLVPQTTNQQMALLRSRYGLAQLTRVVDAENIWLATLGGPVTPSDEQTSMAAEAVAMQMADLDFVEVAEADYPVYGAGYPLSTQNFPVPFRGSTNTAPNDPFFDDQWFLGVINAPDAWNKTTGDADVLIAVLDSGVELDHPDLAANLASGYDFVNGDNLPEDDLGHGTHVASIIAGTTNNGLGVAGVNWNARIMPIKVLDELGVGSVSQIIQGINWAVDNGADVINLSLGSPSDSALLRRTVTNAVNDGVVIVAASGNEFENGNSPSYPAVYDNVIAVGATDEDGAHASFSSSGEHLLLVAPGVDILAATWTGSGGEYAWYSGTSMSTPIVSGVVGLLLSVDNSLTPARIQTVLTGSAQDIGVVGWDPLTGYGIVDADAAIGLIQDALPTVTPIPTNTPTNTPTNMPVFTPTQTPTPAPDLEGSPEPPAPAAEPSSTPVIYLPFVA